MASTGVNPAVQQSTSPAQRRPGSSCCEKTILVALLFFAIVDGVGVLAIISHWTSLGPLNFLAKIPLEASTTMTVIGGLGALLSIFYHYRHSKTINNAHVITEDSQAPAVQQKERPPLELNAHNFPTRPMVVPTPIKKLDDEVERQANELMGGRYKPGKTLWLGEEKQAITLGEIAGEGGSKRVIEISEDEVLVLTDICKADEEVQVSDRLLEMGICTVESKKVDVYFDKGSSHSLPAYTCPSFKSLAKKGRFVLDSKCGGTDTSDSCIGWGERSLLPVGQDRYVLNNWIPVLKPLIKDGKKSP